MPNEQKSSWQHTLGKKMDISNERLVVLASGQKPNQACIELLKANGFDVEIQDKLQNIPDYFGAEIIEQNTLKFPRKTKREKYLVQKTCDLLISNIVKKFVLDDIASSVGSNRTQLAGAFKHVLGIGVFEWLRKQRMLKAKSLLLRSDLSIQEIGFEVGYENSANFSSAYKKHFNICPREERNKAKIEIVTQSKVLLT